MCTADVILTAVVTLFLTVGMVIAVQSLARAARNRRERIQETHRRLRVLGDNVETLMRQSREYGKSIRVLESSESLRMQREMDKWLSEEEPKKKGGK